MCNDVGSLEEAYFANTILPTLLTLMQLKNRHKKLQLDYYNFHTLQKLWTRTGQKPSDKCSLQLK